MKRTPYEGTWQKPRGYSPMVVTEGGRTLWLSGHVGASEESGGWGFSPDFDTQVHQVFRNIEKTLSRAGASLQDIVTMTAYISDARYSERFIEVRKKYFSEIGYPCSALIAGVSFAKPDIMVEVQAIAVTAATAAGG